MVGGFLVSYDNGRDRQEQNFTANERETAHKIAESLAGRHFRVSVIRYEDAGCYLDGKYEICAGGIVRKTADAVYAQKKGLRKVG